MATGTASAVQPDEGFVTFVECRRCGRPVDERADRVCPICRTKEVRRRDTIASLARIGDAARHEAACCAGRGDEDGAALLNWVVWHLGREREARQKALDLSLGGA